MSDKENSKYGKGDKPEEERILQKPKVRVEAPPRNDWDETHRKISERVKEGVKKRVDEAIEESKSGGYKKQLDAAKKAVEDEAQKVPRSPIKKIKVRVEGDVEGPDGKKVGVNRIFEADPSG